MKRAMILAAGRGTRMGTLTETTSKVLLRVGNHYLIEYALQRLKEAGIFEIVINVFHFAEQIQDVIGDGSRYGVTIHYSIEDELLETGGGIVKALPLLGEEPFLVMSGDIISDFPLKTLTNKLTGLAHLVMVTNPAYHVSGDFGLDQNKLSLEATPKLTFANIGIYHPSLFRGCKPIPFRLASILTPNIQDHLITGEHYHGFWMNVGTPQDLVEANKLLQEPALR